MSKGGLSLVGGLIDEIGLVKVSPLMDTVLLGLIGLIIGKNLFDLWTASKDPYGGTSWFEPKAWARMRFSSGAKDMIHEGYERFRGKHFQLLRNDKNILVIPKEQVDDLRNHPSEKLSSIQALVENMEGQYFHLDFLLESNLHTRILQSKLTPKLADFTMDMVDEFDYAIHKALPDVQEEWKEVKIYGALRTLVARISARVFVGESTARNDRWIETSIKYTECATMTTMILRACPKLIRPAVARMLPSYWEAKNWVRQGLAILMPEIEARKQATASDPHAERPNDFLQWMMDAANKEEGATDKLALRELIMGLAAVHTTTMAVAHVLYDMCSMPGYFEVMRDEMTSVLKEDGGWQRQTPQKLRKLDSLLKESQRVSPASLLGFHRIVQNESIRLSDGKVLPPGTHICTASYDISRDPAIIPDQDYDALRYYNLRAKPETKNLLQYAMTDKVHMHFGHGRYACPGRFFASNIMKIILTELLMRYEFKFVEGQTRPENLNADEFLYAHPDSKLLVRKRAIA